MIFIIANVGLSQDIINETGKDGKFIVRDAEQKEQLRVEDGNVAITGELKIETMTEGTDTDAMVVWDRVDKSLKVVPRVFSKVSPLSVPLNTGIGHSIGYDGLAEDNMTPIKANVQALAVVAWNTFTTDYGYIKLGPANQYDWANIYTNKGRFLFNRDLFTFGSFGSYYYRNLYFKTGHDIRLTVLYDNGNVGIGTTTPLGMLDIVSTVGALIVPRMTETQRDGLPTINGSIIYNTTGNQFNFYENGSWVTK